MEEQCNGRSALRFRYGGQSTPRRALESRNSGLLVPGADIARSVSVNKGPDFRKLRDWPPMSVFTVIRPDRLSQSRRLTRLILSNAIRAHFRPGPVNTLFVLDEFRATVGKLQIVLD